MTTRTEPPQSRVLRGPISFPTASEAGDEIVGALPHIDVVHRNPWQARFVAYGFWVVLLFLLILTALAIHATKGVRDSAAAVRHTLEVRNTIADLRRSLTSLSAGMRGAALTHDRAFVDLLTAGRRALLGQLDRLRALTTDNPAQQERLDNLTAQLRQSSWLQETAAAAAPQSVEQLQRQTQDLESILEALDAAETRLLGEREAQLDASTARGRIWLLALALAAAALLLAMGIVNRNDLTARSSAIEAIDAARRFAENILATTHQPLIVLDGDLRVRHANRAFVTTFKIAPAALEGRSFFELENGRWDVPNLRHLLENALSSRAAVDSFEFRHEPAHLGARILLVSARAIEGASGAPPSLLVGMQDVTDRRRAEQLDVERQSLERTNRELQEFAYVASHDLQEPLRKIQAFSDRINTKYSASLPDECRDYLRRMENAARRMRVLIDDLLSFSRVTTKAAPFEPVELDRLVREVLGDLETRIEETRASIDIDALPRIDGDPTQMRQLFQNLLSNALKFHRPDVAPVIQIRTRPAADRQCQIAIQDNGIGFDEKYLDRIFTIFQRLHGRDEYEGTGLGLAICRKIVERHHGRITAESRLGEGSTFLVTLPLHQTDM